MLTKPQPEALFVAQREATLHWSSAQDTQAVCPSEPSHLRACDITGTGSETGNESSQRDMGTLENSEATNRTDVGATDVTDMNDSMDEISMVK